MFLVLDFVVSSDAAGARLVAGDRAFLEKETGTRTVGASVSSVVMVMILAPRRRS